MTHAQKFDAKHAFMKSEAERLESEIAACDCEDDTTELRLELAAVDFWFNG